MFDTNSVESSKVLETSFCGFPYPTVFTEYGADSRVSEEEGTVTFGIRVSPLVVLCHSRSSAYGKCTG